MRRSVIPYQDSQGPIETWDIRCDTCPLSPHLKALGQPGRACLSGVITNAQGAVPLTTCPHYTEESAKDDDGKVSIECTYREEG